MDRNIGKLLSAYVPDRFRERLAAGQERIKNHPEIIKLLKKYPQHEEDLLSPTLYKDTSEYIACIDKCRACPGLENCTNLQPGHYLVPEVHKLNNFVEETISFRYRACKLHKAEEKRRQMRRLVKSHHVSSTIRSATFDSMDMDGRTPEIMECMKFCTEFEPGKTTKGVYLHGLYGAGKSHIAGAMANELASREIDVAMVYVPEFIEELKDSFGSSGTAEKIEALKKVTVLILDDIGAEPLTSWARDGVIGAILNARMQNCLSTFYTSNLTLEELQDHLAKTKDGYDEQKSERIMERIEPFVQVVKIVGRNRRRS